MRAVFEEQLAKLQTDYIDFYLMHAVAKERWDKMLEIGCIEELERLKEEKEEEAAADPYRAAFEATRGTGGAPGKGTPPVKDGEGDGKAE